VFKKTNKKIHTQRKKKTVYQLHLNRFVQDVNIEKLKPKAKLIIMGV
jgi:hypothetical protein